MSNSEGSHCNQIHRSWAPWLHPNYYWNRRAFVRSFLMEAVSCSRFVTIRARGSTCYCAPSERPSNTLMEPMVERSSDRISDSVGAIPIVRLSQSARHPRSSRLVRRLLLGLASNRAPGLSKRPTTRRSYQCFRLFPNTRSECCQDIDSKSTALSGKRPGRQSLVHHDRDGMCCCCHATRVDRALYALVHTALGFYEPASRKPVTLALHARVSFICRKPLYIISHQCVHSLRATVGSFLCCAWKKLISPDAYALIVFYAASVRSLRLKPVVDNVSDSVILSSRTHALAHFYYVLEGFNTTTL